MKTYFISGILSLGMLLFFTNTTTAQDVSAQDIDLADSTGLPGDHFSLQGAIELFKKASSPEEFEKLLNAEDNNVNNLDLNEDGKVDYIRVIDNADGDVHALILQVPMSEKEAQDIAVIEIEKQNEDFTILQIVGDEDIYGEQTIAEPFEEEAAAGDGRGGPSVQLKPYRIVVNVRLWPCVGFIYRPGYRLWVSPWRFAYYPTWYRPWRPRPWRVHYVYARPYHRHCHVVRTHRVVRAHKVYAPRRSHSTVVHTRTTTTVAARRANGTAVGKRTTTTTTKATKNGRTTTTQKSTTTKAGAKQGKAGRAAGKKTTTSTSVSRSGKKGQATARKSTTTTKAAKKGKNGRAVGKKTTTTKTARKKRGG